MYSSRLSSGGLWGMTWGFDGGETGIEIEIDSKFPRIEWKVVWVWG